MRNFFQRLVALTIVSFLVIPPAVAQGITSWRRTPETACFNAQALAPDPLASDNHPTIGRPQAWALRSGHLKDVYKAHTTFRLGTLVISLLIGLITVFDSTYAQWQLSLHGHINHHSMWTALGLLLFSAVSLIRVDAPLLRRLPKAHRESYLIFTMHLFSIVVMSAFISSEILHDTTFYVLSCVFRNAAALVWSIHTYFLLNNPSRQNSPGIKSRLWLGAVLGGLIFLSGPSDLLAIFRSHAGVFHRSLIFTNGFRDWLLTVGIFLVWVASPLSLRHRNVAHEGAFALAHSA